VPVVNVKKKKCKAVMRQSRITQFFKAKKK
jgi:hypothetical protein